LKLPQILFKSYSQFSVQSTLILSPGTSPSIAKFSLPTIESEQPILKVFFLSVLGGGTTGSLPYNIGSFGLTQGTPNILKAPPLLNVEYTWLIVI
jgi:hypothetical protein